MFFTIKKEEFNYLYDWDVETSHSELRSVIRSVAKAKIRKLLEAGKLPDDWVETCRNFGDVLAEKADIMLYPDKKTIAEANKIFEGLTDVIAICAFIPGGICLFGYQYEAKF